MTLRVSVACGVYALHGGGDVVGERHAIPTPHFGEGAQAEVLAVDLAASAIDVGRILTPIDARQHQSRGAHGLGTLLRRPLVPM